MRSVPGEARRAARALLCPRPYDPSHHLHRPVITYEAEEQEQTPPPQALPRARRTTRSQVAQTARGAAALYAYAIEVTARGFAVSRRRARQFPRAERRPPR